MRDLALQLRREHLSRLYTLAADLRRLSTYWGGEPPPGAAGALAWPEGGLARLRAGELPGEAERFATNGPWLERHFADEREEISTLLDATLAQAGESREGCRASTDPGSGQGPHDTDLPPHVDKDADGAAKAMHQGAVVVVISAEDPHRAGDARNRSPHARAAEW